MSNLPLDNPFIRDPKDYKQFVDPFKEYSEQASVYISKKLDVPIEEATLLVTEALKDSDMRAPTVEYYLREDNFDKFKQKTNLIKYINTAKSRKEIMAPSLTTYLPVHKLESFQKKFIQGNLAKRKAAKKKMSDAKAEGRTDDFIYYNVLQKVLKIFNNSLSGAYTITTTPLYNPSAHYTLTSITRSVASIGNAVSEMLVSGNRYYKDENSVYNAITATITYVNMEVVKKAIDVFKLHIPTPTECLSVVKHSSDLYFQSDSFEKDILYFFTKLSDLERAAFVYTNDFYHIKKYNDRFARSLIGALAKRVTGHYENHDYSIMTKVDEFVINLVHHICAKDIQGVKVDYEKLKDTEIMDALVSTTKNVILVLDKAKPLIDAFFGSDVMPINIADIKEMTRRCIVLSDTDSTCATYNDYVTWYFGTDLQAQEATAVTAAVMTINTQVIDHFLKELSTNMGVIPELRGMLAMKNEFYWPVMVPANVSKHYYAGVKIQEGVVFKELERELKGVHLHANNLPPYFKDKSMEMIDKIQEEIVNNQKIDLYKYVKFVADLELEIIETLQSFKPDTLKNGKVKEAKAYTLPESQSAYRYHKLWNQVFGEKYGMVDEPPYTTYDLPVVLDTKKRIATFRETPHGSKKVVNDFCDFVTENFGNGLSTLKLPKSKIDTVNIPKELTDIIDYKRSVETIMNSFYIILETIGFYRKPNFLVHEQILL